MRKSKNVLDFKGDKSYAGDMSKIWFLQEGFIMKKWTDRIETPIKAELICYDVNGIQIVFGVTEEKELKLFHFSRAPFDVENLCRKPDNWWPMEGMREAQIKESFQLVQVNFPGITGRMRSMVISTL